MSRLEILPWTADKPRSLIEKLKLINTSSSRPRLSKTKWREEILGRFLSWRKMRMDGWQSTLFSMIRHGDNLFSLMQGHGGRKKASTWAYPRDENWFADVGKSFRRKLSRQSMEGWFLYERYFIRQTRIKKCETKFRAVIPVEK